MYKGLLIQNQATNIKQIIILRIIFGLKITNNINDCMFNYITLQD